MQRDNLCIPGKVCEDKTYGCLEDNNSVTKITLNDKEKTYMSKGIQARTIKIGESVLVEAEDSVNGIHVEPKALVTNHTESRRLLDYTKLTGDVYFLVVKVIDVNGKQHPHSLATISDNIFGENGDPVNMKSVIADCSADQLRIHAGYPSTLTQAEKDAIDAVTVDLGNPVGVMEAQITIDMTSVEVDAVETATTPKVQELLGFDPVGRFDHVIYVVEGCYGNDCGFAAYAYMDWYLQVYVGDYYKDAAVQTHEYGHNLGLSHSGIEGYGEYTDHTCTVCVQNVISMMSNIISFN